MVRSGRGGCTLNAKEAVSMKTLLKVIILFDAGGLQFNKPGKELRPPIPVYSSLFRGKGYHLF